MNRRNKRGYGMVEETQTESLEIRQARLDERAKVEAEIDEGEYGDELTNIETEIESTLDYLTQFSVFENKLDHINGTLVEADLYVRPDGDYNFGFNDVAELDQMKGYAEDLVKQAKDTKYSETARAINSMVQGEIPDLLMELVQLSEDSENMTF